MLRRNSSRNKQRRPLGRSKSTNSIVRNPVHALESINPIAAERDAHIAATLSYQRAQGRRSGDMAALAGDHSGFAWRNENTTDKHAALARSDSMVSPNDTSSNACGLKRQQSVRFAGPNARPKRVLATRAKDGRSSRIGDSLMLQAMGNSDHRSVDGSLQSYISGLQPSEDYYTPEDDVASMPSSYRKLRKSRSMFTSSSAPPTKHYSHDTPSELTKRWLTDSHFSSLDKENKFPGARRPHLRAPKSTNLLRQRREPTGSRASSRAENDFGVQLAREKFREQVEQQSRLKSHPSLFFRSKFKSSESSTGFRRSLRNTSNNSTGLSSAFSGNTLSISKHTGLRKTARKVSKTLRSKLKGLFGRPKSTDGIAETAAEQARTHDSDADSCLGMEDIPPPEEASMSRVPSRMPSLHAVPSNQQMRSHQGSMESLESEEHQIPDDKSRVTSWTNSITNTVASQGTVGDWERQRLSVIKENGMHVPLSASNNPLHHRESPLHATTLATGVPVDSQRVYSALMKRVEEINQRGIQLRKKSVDDFMSHGIAPPRSSSVDHVGSQGWSPSTIRCVQADDDVFQDKKSKYELDSDHSLPGSVAKSGKVSKSDTPSSSCNSHPRFVASDSKGLSPEKSIRLRSDMDSPRVIPHRTSAFFASPTYHTFRTASPFRRALQENMKASREPQDLLSPDTRHLNSLSALQLPVRQPSLDSEMNHRNAYAESIYSSPAEDPQGCRIRGNTPVAENFPEPPKGSGHGDATIFVDPPKYKLSPSHQRNVSTASSVEWKTWLSANVSKLEDSRGDTSYTLPTIGHVREHAEIDSPEEVLRPEVYNPWRSGPGTPLRPVEGNSRSISSRCAPEKTGRSPNLTDENAAPAAKDNYSRSPPIPIRSILRTVPSLPSMKVDLSSWKARADSVPRMRSYNTIALAKSSPLSRDDLQVKRRSRTRLAGTASSIKSSPGLTAAVERQFGTTNSESAGAKAEKRREQIIYTPRKATNLSADDLSGMGLMGPDLDAQVMGSKRMVDLFLSSRRRRIEGTGTGSEGSAAAFV